MAEFGATDRQFLMAELALGVAQKECKRIDEAIDTFERIRQSFDDIVGTDQHDELGVDLPAIARENGRDIRFVAWRDGRSERLRGRK